MFSLCPEPSPAKFVCPEPSPAKSVCLAKRLQSADRSDFRAVCRDAPVSCRQMAPLKMVRELNVPKRSPIQLFVEPNLD